MQIDNIVCLMTQVSQQIHKLHGRCKSEFFNRQQLFSLVDKNPNKAISFHHYLSAINASTADCENVTYGEGCS